MPRSSSGEFHAHLTPCVAVNAPPSGGPTSSPNTSVSPWRSSATCSAIRIACTMFDMASALPDHVVVGEDVIVDGLAVGLRLEAHPLVGLLELHREARAQVVHLLARADPALLELALESDQTV